MAFQDVILTQKIDKLGAESDIVRVRAGYARNFLIPSGKALEKTNVNLARLNRLKKSRAEREAQELNEAQDLARKINKVKLTFELETGEQGKAFGSITSNDIADKLRAELGSKVTIDRHTIQLEKPIKTTGDFEIEVKLSSEVVAKLNVTVKPAKTEEKAAEGEAEEGKSKAKARK